MKWEQWRKCFCTFSGSRKRQNHNKMYLWQLLMSQNDFLFLKTHHLESQVRIKLKKDAQHQINKSRGFKNLTWIRSHHLQWKFKLLAGKFTWCCKAKHCWVMSTNSLSSKVCWKRSAMFCLYTSSKLSCP